MSTLTLPHPLTSLDIHPTLHLGDVQMDQTHTEFFEHLHTVLQCPEEEQLSPYHALVAHTEQHFTQEERWMVAIGFEADNCHASHHAEVLNVMRTVIDHAKAGDLTIITRMCEALLEWFPSHAMTMDAGLAEHMRTVGFDSQTETLTDPSRVRPARMSGCGSVTCRE